jgi:hypothetical protein
MYAVFSNGSIVYLGNDRTDALQTLDSKDGATLSQVNTLASLSGAFTSYKSQATSKEEPSEENPDPDDPLEDASAAMEKILEKLDAAGFNAENTEEFYQGLREKAVDAVAEVKGLGIKSMSVVGEGFIALGDLLKAIESPPEDDEGSSEDESNDTASILARARKEAKGPVVD